MSDHDALEELAAALFDAGRGEHGPDAARARTLETLLGRPSSSGPRTNVAPIELPVESASRAEMPGAQTRPRARVALGLLAAAAVCALALLARDVARESASIAPARDVLRVQTPASQRRAASDSERASSLRTTAPLEASAPKAPAKAHRDVRHAPATLTEEVAALDAARSALAAGDAKRALAQLERYDSELHGARLHTEALLLRSEALAADGREADAAELAREFLAKYPSSPLADRARALARGDAP